MLYKIGNTNKTMLKIIPTNESLSRLILYPTNPNAAPIGHRINGNTSGIPWIINDTISNKKLTIKNVKTDGIRMDISPGIFCITIAPYELDYKNLCP
jgi:hypothetical protein